MNKRLISLPLVIFSLSLLSCGKEIRPDLKEFLDPINIDLALTNTSKAYMEYVFIAKDNVTNEEISFSKSYLYFDKSDENNLYAHKENYYKGSYVNTQTQIDKEIWCYSLSNIEEKTYFYLYESSTSNGEVNIDESKVSKDDVTDFITDFFYRTVQNGVHSGGMYYAEDIGVISSYQNFMKVSDDKLSLTVSFDDFEVDGVNNSLTYTINSVGMLTSYKLVSYDDKTTLNGSITIKYNENAIDFKGDLYEEI